MLVNEENAEPLDYCCSIVAEYDHLYTVNMQMCVLVAHAYMLY